MMGNGHNGVQTAISKDVLGAFQHLYNLFDISQADQNYALGTDTYAFRTQDYTSWDRSEDTGADPLDVVLICVVGCSLVVLVWRGDRRLRAILAVGIGLTLG